MKKIAILDTTNYNDFPIGGQLSSIKNFLKYCNYSNLGLEEFVLIGITKDVNHCIGEINKIYIDDVKINFLPVAYIPFDENSVEQSLRKIFLRGIFDNISAIKKQNIDIFYIHTIEAFLPIYIFFRSKKRVLFSHGNFLSILNYLRFGSKIPFFKIAFKGYIKFCLRKSNQIYVLDEFTRNQYSKYTSIENIHLVNNSIDLSLYNNSVYHKYKNEYNLIFVGRLSENKGIDNIIRSLLYIEKFNVSLKIVGAGEELDYLKRLVNENSKLKENVEFVGKKTGNDLINIYSNSDMLIMNSKTEGTPMVILEAMASGIPIVTTPVGNIPYIVKEGYNGEFTNGNPNDIAKKIEVVISKLNYYKKNSKKESYNYCYKNVNKIIYEYLNK